MAINNITITNAATTPGRVIAPVGSTPSLPNPPDSQIGDQDLIEVSAGAGSDPFVGYIIDSGLAADTVSLNGSPISTVVSLGAGNDLFTLNTVLLGGAMDKSSISGNEGNDVFQLLNGNTVTNSILDGGFGSDLFQLQGSFTRVAITGGAGNDVARFESPGANGKSNFALSLVGLGAGDDLFEDGGFKLTTNSSSFNGGGGKDTINLSSSEGGSGADGTLITGGADADFLYGTKTGDNTVLSGAGADFAQVFEGDDSVVGGGGSDTILLGAGQDTAQGGDGNDVVFGFFGGLSGDATVDGGTGSDVILGGTGDDSLFGGEGGDRDYLAGWLGNDKIDGGSGDDLIFGDGISADGAAGFQVNGITVLGRNAITGDAGPGISGLFQDPSLGNIATWFGFGAPIPGLATWSIPPLLATQLASKVNTAPDFAPWSGTNESKTGTIMADGDGGLVLSVLQEILLANNLRVPSSDPLFPPIGGNGNDTLTGNSGSDTIFGGSGSDKISGGLGSDVLVGTQGADTLTGDDGNDTFVQGLDASRGADTGTRTTFWTFNWTNGGPDVITDFKATNNNGATIDQVAFAETAGAWALTNADNNVVRNATGSADFNAWALDDVVLFRGTWTAATKQFVTNNTGNDALVFRATNNTGTVADMGDQVVVLQGSGAQAFTGDNFFGTFA